MTQEKRDELIRVLRARVRMHSHINKDREEIAMLTTGDEFERLQLASERDVLLHHVSHQSQMLRDMNDALQRLEDQTYGYCLACDQEISPKRLAAIPWVSYCVQCQEQIENAQPTIKGDVFQELAA